MSPKARIALVEDDIFVQSDLQHSLEEAGFRVLFTAATASEAQAYLSQSMPDLVLLDIQLADGSTGLEVAQWLRSNAPQVPFLYLTAQRDAATRQEALATLPALYLTKPVFTPDLLTNIELLLQQQQYSAKPSSEGGKETRPELEQATSSVLQIDLLRHVFFIQKEYLFIKKEGAFERLPLSSLVYLEADGGSHSRLYTRQGDNLMLSAGFSKLLQKLPQPPFCRISRKHVVRLDQVERFSDGHVTLQGMDLPLGPTYRSEFLKGMTEV